MQKSRNPIALLFGSPVVWGCALCAAFYVLVHRGVIHSAFITRYFTESGIEYVETGMFCVALFALLFKLNNVLFQKRWILRQEKSPEPFFPVVSGGSSPRDAVTMRDKIRQLPAKFQETYFFRRMNSALDFVVRNNSAEGFEDEMKYLSDLDASRMSGGYSFVRVIIWAIPILGFLGTVMGITLAIGELGGNLSDTETTLPKMISGLSVAFDTTALALSFSIVLMFVQYFVEKAETALLDRVDQQVHRELFGRFSCIPNTPDGLVSAVRAMGETILERFDQCTQRQTAIWERSFQQVGAEWAQRMEVLGAKLVSAYQTAFDSVGVQFARQTADTLGPVISDELEKSLRNHWATQWQAHITEVQEIQKTLADQAANLRNALEQNEHFMARSGDWITAVSGQFQGIMEQLKQISLGLQNLAGMENVLSQNLSTLQGAKNFERTVAELSASTAELADWLREVRESREGRKTKA